MICALRQRISVSASVGITHEKSFRSPCFLLSSALWDSICCGEKKSMCLDGARGNNYRPRQFVTQVAGPFLLLPMNIFAAKMASIDNAIIPRKPNAKRKNVLLKRSIDSFIIQRQHKKYTDFDINTYSCYNSARTRSVQAILEKE